MSRLSSVAFAGSLLLALSATADAQRSRWNTRVEPDTLGEAPTVRVWIDGPRSYPYGAPVRVRFSVDQNAYVLVARVDGNGHVTVLHPSSRTRSQLVNAGDEVLVRSRTGGSNASFFATDRTGGGYVFAMASYDPFDLSPLGIRDFDRHVTGVGYVGRPTRTYIGDPYRVVSRFASMVLFDERTPYDFDVDYYDVGGPSYITSVGYSAYCGGYGFGAADRYYGASSLQQRYDDALYYGGIGSAYDDCYGARACALGLAWMRVPFYGFGVPMCGYWTQPNVATNPPRPPIPTTPSDTGRIRGPLVDSIAGTRPTPPIPTTTDPNADRERPPAPPRIARDAEGDGFVYGGHRRGPTDSFDGEGRTFSIPERALVNLRRRGGNEPGVSADLRALPTRGGERERGARDGIDWVRPPVEVIRGGATAGDQALPRAGRRGGGGDAGAPRGQDGRIDRGGWLPPNRETDGRFNRPERFSPPSRTDGPRFINPPSINAGGQIRQESGGRSPDAGRADAPRIQMERPTPPPQQPVQPPAAKDPGSSEKKPQ